VLPQEIMIQKVCKICEQDGRLVAALMYSYFTLGQGDQYSDDEFHFFFRDEVLAEVDEEAWVSQIAPVELYLR
jgi:hypothetical protein